VAAKQATDLDRDCARAHARAVRHHLARLPLRLGAGRSQQPAQVSRGRRRCGARCRRRCRYRLAASGGGGGGGGGGVRLLPLGPRRPCAAARLGPARDGARRCSRRWRCCSQGLGGVELDAQQLARPAPAPQQQHGPQQECGGGRAAQAAAAGGEQRRQGQPGAAERGGGVQREQEEAARAGLRGRRLAAGDRGGRASSSALRAARLRDCDRPGASKAPTCSSPPRSSRQKLDVRSSGGAMPDENVCNARCARVACLLLGGRARGRRADMSALKKASHAPTAATRSRPQACPAPLSAAGPVRPGLPPCSRRSSRRSWRPRAGAGSAGSRSCPGAAWLRGGGGRAGGWARPLQPQPTSTTSRRPAVGSLRALGRAG
jgi:hypothetical protein